METLLKSILKVIRLPPCNLQRKIQLKEIQLFFHQLRKFNSFDNLINNLTHLQSEWVMISTEGTFVGDI